MKVICTYSAFFMFVCNYIHIHLFSYVFCVLLYYTLPRFCEVGWHYFYYKIYVQINFDISEDRAGAGMKMKAKLLTFFVVVLLLSCSSSFCS